MNDENKTETDSILIQTLKNIMQDADTAVRNKLLNEVCNPRYKNERILRALKDNSLRQIWNTSTAQKEQNKLKEIKQRLELSMQLTYRHKCLESRIIKLDSSGTSIQKPESKNFDFADLDTLFEVESDSEPASKKVKLNVDVEEIICQLERDASTLRNVKENLNEYKSRIRNVCDKLDSLIR